VIKHQQKFFEVFGEQHTMEFLLGKGGGCFEKQNAHHFVFFVFPPYDTMV
jgi:hypothetical protein